MKNYLEQPEDPFSHLPVEWKKWSCVFLSCMKCKTGLFLDVENRWQIFMVLLCPEVTLHCIPGEIHSYGTKNSLI